jgi:hypothetical protein
VGDRRDQGSDRAADDRERGLDKRENDPEQAVIGMIGGVQEDLDLRACRDDQRFLCKAVINFLLLLRFFVRFVRCFPSQGGMRAIGSIGGRYLVSTTKRWGYPRNPLWCLSATEEYS